MYLPKFIITTNKQLDTDSFIEFFEAKIPVIFECMPQIKTKQDVMDAINFVYKNHKQYIDKTISFLKDNEDKLKDLASILSKKLEYNWDGIDKITIYPSVCPVCPRFIEDNSFLVTYFFDNNAILRICAHEMSHFLYFKKLKDLLPNHIIDTEYPGKDWLISEIIAPILINSKEIQKIVNNADEFFTPDKNIVSIDQIEKIKELYRREKDLLIFREKALKIL